MECNPQDVQNLLIHGYDDYMASRALLKTKFIRQATIHASTAIEKYLKALILVCNGAIKKKVHLDKLSELKQEFSSTAYKNIFDVFEPNFIEIIGKAYAFRYLDNIRALDSVGFLINQFLGELDYTINVLESCFKFNGWETPYQTDLRNKAPDLFENNWKLERWPKRIFMQQKSMFYGMTYDPIARNLYDISTIAPISAIYTGRMYFLKVKFENRSNESSLFENSTSTAIK